MAIGLNGAKFGPNLGNGRRGLPTQGMELERKKERKLEGMEVLGVNYEHRH